MGNKKYYLVHPYETYGVPVDNRIKERIIADDLLEKYPQIKLIRPFLEVPLDIDRKKAMEECLRLVRESDGIILAPMWFCSDGCFQEYLYAKKLGKEIFFFDKKRRGLLPDLNEEK